MNTFMKRAGIVGAAGAASALLVAGVVAPAQATEDHGSSSYSSYNLTKKVSEDNDHYSSVSKTLNDNLNGFTARDNDRNGILNGDDFNVTDVLNGDNAIGNVSDIANGDVLSDNGGNEILNGNDTLNGNEVGNVETGDIASGDVSTGDIGSNIGNGDVNVLNDAEVLNDTIDVVDNTVSNTLKDVLNTDEGSSWGGGDWHKW